MKCVDCQFHLLCHAGRLDSWSADQQSVVLLCPACNRLCVGQHQTLYVFSCEKRRFKRDEEGWRARFADLESTRITDPGPGLIGKLTVARCVDCLSTLPPRMRNNLKVKYLDENRKDTLDARLAQQYAEAIEAEGIDDTDTER